ncbi:MAG: HlyC/CorC family transporter [Clostridia bacterium]|nr:HlyC/CorC family transporter [Clostridia bacterium]
MSNTTSIIFMAVMVAFSAYFSATETAFSSLNKTRLKVLAEKGDKKAILALELSDKYDKMITSILIGNNIVNIAMTSVCTLLFVHLMADAGATVSTIVSTVVVLIFGEITPKSLAKEMPEKFAMFSAPFLRVLMILLTPFSFVFTTLKNLMGKVIRNTDDRRMTQEELLMLVDEVQQEGGLDEDEHELLRSAIEFTDRDAEDILTHRVDLEAVSIHDNAREISKVFDDSRFSRLLVYDEDIDDIVGVIHQSDFYNDCVMRGKDLSEIMSEPVFVPKSLKISDLLKLLQKKKSHIAIVNDGYGGTLGIVTMEDILEELVGEIWDEHDEVVEDIRSEGDNVWTVSGNADLYRLLDKMDIDEDAVESASITGWIMEQLEKVPDVGDSFVMCGWKVTVTATDERRVQEIRVEQLENHEENDG